MVRPLNPEYAIIRKKLISDFFKRKDRPFGWSFVFSLKKVDTSIKNKIIEVCTEKINLKGSNVGLSFYAFFSNKNTKPELLMEVAEWWIMKHKLDHFEKAIKIRDLVKQEI